METAFPPEAAAEPLKRAPLDARDASSDTSPMAPNRRRFRLALRIGLTLLGVVTAGLILLADGVDAKSGTFKGFVFEAEKAVFLEADDGNIYVLKGKDLKKYYDKYVEVSGETKANAQGENELTVTSVKAATPGTGISEDQPAKGKKQ